METVQLILDYVQGNAMWWGLLMLMLASSIEYVFPPFPGDSVTLVGAMLIPTAGWPAWAVFAAVMIGSMSGAFVDWRFGVWLSHRRERAGSRFLSRPRVKKRLDKIEAKFEKHGAKFLALNRFLPAFRALLFVAAGLARLPIAGVLFWAALSAAAWNMLLLGVGWAVGYNLESLVKFIESYTIVVLGSLAVGLLAWGIFRRVRGLAHSD